MLKTLIIADDSTGANASAILLKKMKLSAISLIDYSKIDLSQNSDVVAISTDSRAVNDEEAYKRVNFVLNKINEDDFMVINKRIDSTLRGNIGAELNAFKNRFPNLKIAIVPVFPSSKRITVNGVMFVNGIKLEDTDVAKDPKMPIHISNVKEIINNQFVGASTNIYLSDIRKSSTLSKKIFEAYRTNDAIIFDGETDADVKAISKALVQAKVKVVATDPGPFTYFYTKEVLSQNKHEQSKYLYLIGSVTDSTFNQLVKCFDHEDFELFYVNPTILLEDNYDRLFNEIKLKIKKSLLRVNVITTTDIENRNVLDLKSIGEKMNISLDDVSKKINEGLAKLLTQVLEDNKNIKAIFTSGGDTTLGFLNLVNAQGIRLHKQVMPLCVYGEIVKGKFDGLRIITKGGMIGEEKAYIEIKEFYEEELEND